MSNGIIQEIFNDYRNMASKRIDGIDGLERQLIKKIRQYHFDDDEYFNDTIKQILIGDNHD